jgi:hypothetical protein
MGCGINYAYFMAICCSVPSSTWQWHLAQWIPIFVGSASFMIIGWDTRKNYINEYHSRFWIYGRIVTALSMAGSGYILGREIFF